MVTHDIQSALRGNRILYLKDGVIIGECMLKSYEESKQRKEQLTAFLNDMGW